MESEILMHQDYEGPPTYPNGATNIFDALDKVENKLNARYVAEQEAEHQHQLEPLPTPESIYQASKDKQKKSRLENICLVRAYIQFPTWKKRVEYLNNYGYYYKGASKTVAQRLQKRIDELTKSGQWQELVKVVEGN